MGRKPKLIPSYNGVAARIHGVQNLRHARLHQDRYVLGYEKSHPHSHGVIKVAYTVNPGQQILKGVWELAEKGYRVDIETAEYKPPRPDSYVRQVLRDYKVFEDNWLNGWKTVA